MNGFIKSGIIEAYKILRDDMGGGVVVTSGDHSCRATVNYDSTISLEDNGFNEAKSGTVKALRDELPEIKLTEPCTVDGLVVFPSQPEFGASGAFTVFRFSSQPMQEQEGGFDGL